MSDEYLLLVGTRKGAFILKSDHRRRNWNVKGPYFDGVPVYDCVGEKKDGKHSLYAAANSFAAPLIQQSQDGGETWRKLPNQPRFARKNKFGLKVEKIWKIQPSYDEEIFAGVEPAGLFRSKNGGVSWTGVTSLNHHSTRTKWQPGAGGLCLHTIIPHPKGKKIRVGISAAGVLGSNDDGETWDFYNRNIRADFMPDKFPVFGQCVHKMALSRGNTLYLQNHGGVYVSEDFGGNWTDIGSKLPSDFGFPIAVHPRDDDKAYVAPLAGDERYPPDAALKVWGSSKKGKNWKPLSKGLPRQCYAGVLRNALTVDDGEPCGIYLGTTTGQLFHSNDEGETWNQLADYLPQIYSVSVLSL